MDDVAWLKRAWNQLQEDFFNRVFKPINETDIQAYLYHLLWMGKPEDRTIVTEYSVKMISKEKLRTKKIDLAILSPRKRTEHSKIRLLIEIKETSSGRMQPETVAKKIERDINKLDSAVRSIGDKRTRKPVQIFFFRQKVGGIEPELDKALRELSKKIGPRFLFGPSRK